MAQKRGSASVDFELPPGARQGPDTWYLIKLHLAITFVRPTGGSAYVSALTNGRAAAQIKFTPAPGGSIMSSSVSLLAGSVKRTSSARRIELTYRNYLQDRGVRPGRNRLTVLLERTGNLRVSELVILRDSGVQVSRLRPARLKLDPILPRGSVRVGDQFRVAFTLRNTGDRPARNVLIAARPSSSNIKVVGQAARRLPLLDGRASGAFRLRATRTGRYRLVLGAAADNANHPLVEIDVPVNDEAATSRSSGPNLRTIAAAAVLLVIATALLLTARKRQGRS